MRIAGVREDEVALFHLHNACVMPVMLLYAATLPPNEMPLVLPDLRSRFAQCSCWALSQLDDAGRTEFTASACRRPWPDFGRCRAGGLPRRASRDLGSLTAIFERLDHASLAAQRRLTVPLLRQVLGVASLPLQGKQSRHAQARNSASSIANRSGVPTSVQRPWWCVPVTPRRAMAARSSGASLKRGGVACVRRWHPRSRGANLQTGLGDTCQYRRR